MAAPVLFSSLNIDYTSELVYLFRKEIEPSVAKEDEIWMTKWYERWWHTSYVSSTNTRSKITAASVLLT